MLCLGLKGLAGHVDSEEDSRRMATQLGAMLGPATLDYIVFVDARPWYGLSLYLDAEVQRISTTPGASLATRGFDPPFSLCDELHERQRRVFLVRSTDASAFEDAVHRCDGRRNRTARELGITGRFSVLRLE